MKTLPVLVAMHAAVHVLDHVLQWGPVATSGSPSPRDVSLQTWTLSGSGVPKMTSFRFRCLRGREFTILLGFKDGTPYFEDAGTQRISGRTFE